jgi:hypothetical protein
MAVASCTEDMAFDIPEALLSGFEDGACGRRYLQNLDARLAAFALSQGAPEID